jgi:hypothetical protein
MNDWSKRGQKVGHETGRSEENTAKVVWKELNREDGQRRREGARIYGEIAQPRSHLLKERLMAGRDAIGG